MHYNESTLTKRDKKMANVIINLAPTEVRRDFYLYGNKADLACAARLEAGDYKIMPSFTSEGIEGEEGAEEAFDLTNNPSRQEEREARYGRYRSVSVGDIVEVDGVDFLCESFGWCQL